MWLVQTETYFKCKTHAEFQRQYKKENAEYLINKFDIFLFKSE